MDCTDILEMLMYSGAEPGVLRGSALVENEFALLCNTAAPSVESGKNDMVLYMCY